MWRQCCTAPWEGLWDETCVIGWGGNLVIAHIHLGFPDCLKKERSVHWTVAMGCNGRMIDKSSLPALRPSTQMIKKHEAPLRINLIAAECKHYAEQKNMHCLDVVCVWCSNNIWCTYLRFRDMCQLMWIPMMWATWIFCQQWVWKVTILPRM